MDLIPSSGERVRARRETQLNGKLQTLLREDGNTFSFGNIVFGFGYKTIRETQKNQDFHDVKSKKN